MKPALPSTLLAAGGLEPPSTPPVAADTLAGLRRRLRDWMARTCDPLLTSYEVE